jgi:hypothetical protein
VPADVGAGPAAPVEVGAGATAWAMAMPAGHVTHPKTEAPTPQARPCGISRGRVPLTLRRGKRWLAPAAVLSPWSVGESMDSGH